jgi:hypothetical protein
MLRNISVLDCGCSDAHICACTVTVHTLLHLRTLLHANCTLVDLRNAPGRFTYVLGGYFMILHWDIFAWKKQVLELWVKMTFLYFKQKKRKIPVCIFFLFFF